MKTSRQNAILNLINSYEIGTQEELCDRLLKDGYKVTQATVSRDIREMKITKVVGENGKQKYVRILGGGLSKEKTVKHATFIKEAVLSVEYAVNIVVVKTSPGMAPAVGSSIDSTSSADMLGCIAGDDTVMCVMRSAEAAEAYCGKLLKLL
jgi:transcriptional regulator of arginine metabolism